VCHGGVLEIAIWSLTAALMCGGLVGVVVPVLPGTTLMFAAAVLHKLLLPESLSWAMVTGIGVAWLLSVVTDFAGVVVGTKWFGGGRWGMAGAGGGALVGVFISLPALLVGTVLGAVVAEKLLGKKTDREALKAGVGAATGFVLATVARLIWATIMIGLFVYAALDGRVR
jgi:uncharacterized protein YqgC (DUF456 family)